ncbi:MAG: UDP-N-acetylglucosamine 2-epimerase (non-hydrolyzing) [SAR324 cluster bacterium]|uniref:UDP-N-acetylglucosamine 2-epimerase (Non-hydrolyzing) n=1 Tax=SAR324 cluster bacterium TaxID=2024889 RepID=A0A7X9IIW8_9DELT|nr:UDP-N-acetylglucosamine 2-epimerase (non-hydrolyzing) [SAR324 cluster bacterium]
MKVLTILGTRPEIIRLSRVIEKLDAVCEQILVHTGQNYDKNLNDVFFEDLKVRKPDYYLEAIGSFGEQIGIITSKMEKIFAKEQPDRFLVLGDTNSSLAAIAAKRLGIPVYHMEAGNRCYDERVPEEVNRGIIDRCSDIFMPYTERSRKNLIREGVPGDRIFVTGNPIFEVIEYYKPQIENSKILAKLGIEERKFILVTMHRQENVDIESRLRSLVAAFQALQEKYCMPVIVSTHPRTRSRMQAISLEAKNSNMRFLDPFGFFDFIKLEKNAYCVLSDSGTVQEECSIFGVPNVTIRDVTERPETIECGSNMLSGAEVESVLRCVNVVLAQESKWTAPPEYLAKNVSDTVVKIVLSYKLPRPGCQR